MPKKEDLSTCLGLPLCAPCMVTIEQRRQARQTLSANESFYLSEAFILGWVNHCLEALISFCCNILSTNFSTAIATTNETQPSHLSSELEGS